MFGTALIVGLLVMMVRRAIVASGASSTTRGRTARRASRSSTATSTAVGDWVFVVTLLVIALTGFVLEGVRIAMDRPGLRRHAVRRLARRAGARAGCRSRRWRGCATGCGGSTACSRSTFVASIPYTKAAHMLTSFFAPVAARPARRQAAAGDPARAAPTSPPATRRSRTSARCTCCSSTRARSAAAATRRVPANATGRPLSPRDVILELREQANAAMRSTGIGGVLGSLLDGRGRRRRLHAQRDRRRRRARRDGLVVHAVQRLRRDLPGRDRAGADHQPAAPAAGRGRRARHQRCSRRSQTIHKSGNSFGENKRKRGRWTDGARLRGQGRAQGAGRRAVVRRRLRVVRPALAAGHPIARAAASTRPASTSGSSTTASATPATTCAASARRGCSSRSPSSNIETLAGCEFKRIVTSDPHSLNTLRNEYPELGRQLAGRCTTPACCSS